MVSVYFFSKVVRRHSECADSSPKLNITDDIEILFIPKIRFEFQMVYMTQEIYVIDLLVNASTTATF